MNTDEIAKLLEGDYHYTTTTDTALSPGEEIEVWDNGAWWPGHLIGSDFREIFPYYVSYTTDKLVKERTVPGADVRRRPVDPSNAPESTPPHPPRPGHARYYELLEELANIHRDKCRVYGNSADPFANFSAGERFGFSKIDMAVMRLVEKLERFRNDKARGFALVPGMGEDNESPERTYREIASLFLILVIMLEESRE